MKSVWNILTMLLVTAYFSSAWAQPADTTDIAVVAAADKIDPKMVVATVADTTITYGKLQEAVEKKYPGMPEMYREKIEENVLERMIDRIAMEKYLDKVKAPDAKKETAEQIKGMRADIKERFGKTLDGFLADTKQTYEEFEKEVEYHVRMMNYLKTRITEKEIKEYFEKNKGRMNTQATVRASHILIKSDEPDTEALKKIKEIKAKIDAGADFAEMAKEYSTCPSGAGGGDLNYFPRKGAMVEPFAKAAFGLKVGQISDPVKTRFGYHLIKVTDKKETVVATLENSKDKISATLSQQKIPEFTKEAIAAVGVKRFPRKPKEKPQPPAETSDTEPK